MRRALNWTAAVAFIVSPIGRPARSQPPPAQQRIVYIREQNIWIMDGEGHGRPITHDGGYRSLSVARDASIGALRSTSNDGHELLRMRTSGEVMSRVLWPRGTLNLPLKAALSPNGQVFAFIYLASDLMDRCGATEYPALSSRRSCQRMALTPSDHWQRLPGTAPLASGADYSNLSWIDDARLFLLGSDEFIRVWLPAEQHLERSIEVRELTKVENAAVLMPRYVLAVQQHVKLEPPQIPVPPPTFSAEEVVDYFQTPRGDWNYGLIAVAAGHVTGISGAPDGMALVFADDRGVQIYRRGQERLTILDPAGTDPHFLPN